jgi:serine protease Do
MKTVFLLGFITFIAYGRWPDTIEKLQKSVCIIEFYQPQYERGEIKDRSRIKRKITGILVNANGLVMTSDEIFPVNIDIMGGNHILPFLEKPPEDITVSFNKKDKLKADLLGKDQELRIAFLQIREIKNLPPAIVFDTTTTLTIGDEIYLLEQLDGRYDYEPVVSQKNINAILSKPFIKWATISEASVLSPGGLVLDRYGNAVGVTFKDDDNYMPEIRFDDRISTAVKQLLPASLFLDLIEKPPILEMQTPGSGKSWMGIRMQILTDDMAGYWELDGIHGIIINSVVPKSPAEKAGLKVGDIINRIANYEILNDEKSTLEIFRNYIRSLPEGPYKLTIYRDKKREELSITLASAPKSLFMAEEYFNEILGVRVKEITQDVILGGDLDFNIEGVWVSRVEDAGPAGLSGLTVDDIIVQVNEAKVKNLNEFKGSVESVLKQTPEYIRFFIKRDGKTQFIFIRIAGETGA